MGAGKASTLLGLQADGAVRDPDRLFHDAVFLAALLDRVEDRIGREDAAAALLQLGFLQGLRDATRILRQGILEAWAETGGGPPEAPRLALRFRLLPGGSGGVAAEGSWPEAPEAEARVGAQGAQEAPSCFVSSGYTSGWLSGMLEADLVAVEITCSACGAPECRFEAREAGAWAGDPRAEFAVGHLDFGALREAVEQEFPPPAPADGFDPTAAAIHVWGPVMVMPFSGADESIAALEMIAREEGARAVSVVVIDLAGAVLDDAFGALALERLLEAIQEWGIEPILTGVSPLSAPVVADLQERHLVIHKDLPEAIASAFQIAEAQRAAC